MQWSEPLLYDLTRTPKRVSVPKKDTQQVPTLPGVYVIVRLDQVRTENQIIDIGMAGLRDSKGEGKPKGLRERIANTITHNASEKIATAIKNKDLSNSLKIVWITVQTTEEAKDLERGLLTLFKKEFGRIPEYNGNGGNSKSDECYQPYYNSLKHHLTQIL